VIAIDANVLLRYVVRDDEEQYQKASQFLTRRSADDTAYVSFIVLAETVWTLRRHYRYSKRQVEELVTELLQAVELSFEQEAYLSVLFSKNAELEGNIADYLVALSADRAGCSATYTFDRNAANTVLGMELLA